MLLFLLIEGLILWAVYHKYRTLRSVVYAFLITLGVFIVFLGWMASGLLNQIDQNEIANGSYHKYHSDDGSSSSGMDLLRGIAAVGTIIYFVQRRKKKKLAANGTQPAPPTNPPSPPVNPTSPPNSF